MSVWPNRDPTKVYDRCPVTPAMAELALLLADDRVLVGLGVKPAPQPHPDVP